MQTHSPLYLRFLPLLLASGNFILVLGYDVLVAAFVCRETSMLAEFSMSLLGQSFHFLGVYVTHTPVLSTVMGHMAAPATEPTHGDEDGLEGS